MINDKIVLREFAYFDRQKVEDFLSSIEDGLAREKKEITHEINAEIKGKLKVPGVAEVGGGVGRKGTELQELKTATDASLFQRLYLHLKNQKLIRFLDKVNKNTWEQIKGGEILELTGEIELSAMENLFDLLTMILPLMKSQKMDEKTRRGTQVLEMISSVQGGVNIKISLEDENYKFVATLPREKVRVTKQELNSAYSVLCRVQRKLKPNETFDLFSFIPGIKFPREQIRNLIRTFPSELIQFTGKPIRIEDFRISHPAMIVTPIAIYR